MEAAVSVFARQGFSQSTVSQIAKQAGVADGTIYLYFKNKEDILVQFFEYKAKQVFERFRQEMRKKDSATDKLAKLLRLHLEAFQNEPDMARLYMTETYQSYRLAEKQIRSMAKMYLDIITEIVEQGQFEGSIRKDLYVGLVKRLIVGSVDEVINTWIHSEEDYDMVSMAEPLSDLILRGIGATGSEST